MQGQGHSLKSSIKVTKFQSALRLLLVNKYKKFEDNAIARVCCSRRNSEKWGKKNPTATGSITILTKSTSWSINIYPYTHVYLNLEMSELSNIGNFTTLVIGIKLVTHALSTKSCTSETDRPSYPRGIIA